MNRVKTLVKLNIHTRAASVLSTPIVPAYRSYASIADKYQDKLKERASAYVQSKRPTDRGREGIQGKNAIQALRDRYASRVKQQASILSAQPIEIKKVPKKSPVKSLASYIDVDKFKLHDPKEMTLLWRARFANQEGTICAVIPEQTYSTIHRTARQNPMFVLPLFRPDQGVEMQFLQWVFPSDSCSHLMITSLLEYKMKGEYSRPHTIIAHHSELADEKGLVFMKGDLTDSRALEPLQASWMIALLQRFYCPLESDSTSARRTKILQDFNKGVDLDMDALIEEAKAVPGAGEI